MEVHVRYVGMARLIEKLRDKEEDIADLRNCWRSAGLYLVKRSVKDSFGKEQSPDGTKWPPWSEKYRKRMEKLGKRGRHKILSDTGELRRSIKYVAFKNRVIVGSNIRYARRHQLGDKGWAAGGGGMPARPYLGVTEQDRTEILRMMYEYFRRRRR